MDKCPCGCSSCNVSCTNFPLVMGERVKDFEFSQVDGKSLEIIQNLTFHDAIRGHLATILLFYPADFTFVCPTEIMAFSEKADLLCSTYKTHIYGISTDSLASHKKFIELKPQEGGLGGSINFPLISDRNHNISQLFGVLDPKSGNSRRGLFIIDSEATLQYSLISNDNVGRNVDELIRVIDGLHKIRQSGGDNVCCIAGFKTGGEVHKKDHRYIFP